VKQWEVRCAMMHADFSLVSVYTLSCGSREAHVEEGFSNFLERGREAAGLLHAHQSKRFIVILFLV
jgi:hypothetical protein